MKNQPRLLLIGMDSATLDLLLPWAREGKLPHLARLIDEGVVGELESTIPPVTPSAWTSLNTGKNPGKHGIFNFAIAKPNSYELRFITGASRRAPTVWKMLSDAGVTVGTINIPFTYPPEPLNGFNIAGADTPSERNPFVHPASLRQEIERKFGKMKLDVRHLGFMSSYERRKEVLKELAQIDDQWTKIANYLLETRPTEVLACTYFSIDTVQHHFWQYMDRNHFMYDEEGAKFFEEAILHAYQRVDQGLGQLLAKLPEDIAVMAFSDHGGGPVSDQLVYVNRALAQAGLLRYKTGPKPLPQRILKKIIPLVYQFLQATLTSRQKSFLADRFAVVREKVEGTRLAAIDWSQTRAYAVESAICINRKGTKPSGIVSDEDYDSIVKQVMECLMEIKDPRTGEQIIQRIDHRDEVYHGPHTPEAPDLLIDMWHKSLFSIKQGSPDDWKQPVVEIKEHKPVQNAEWGGTHRQQGLFIMKGPGCRRHARISGARLIDIAPTILHYFGQPIPEDMDGEILAEVFTQEFRPAKPSGPAPDAAPRPFQGGRKAAKDQEMAGVHCEWESALLHRRLRLLGYVE